MVFVADMYIFISSDALNTTGIFQHLINARFKTFFIWMNEQQTYGFYISTVKQVIHNCRLNDR